MLSNKDASWQTREVEVLTGHYQLNKGGLTWPTRNHARTWQGISVFFVTVAFDFD